MAILGCVRTKFRLKPAPDASVAPSTLMLVGTWFRHMVGLGQVAVAEPEAIQSSYQLCVMAELTPQQLIQTHVANGDFEVALQLCGKHGLDKDFVRQAQWETSDHSHDAILAYLDPAEDTSWVLSECIGRIPKSSSAAESLLRYGDFR